MRGPAGADIVAYQAALDRSVEQRDSPAGPQRDVLQELEIADEKGVYCGKLLAALEISDVV